MNLAMVPHLSFSEWLLSGVAIEDGLTLAGVTSFVLFCVSFWRRYPLSPPFFSTRFLLALGPFVSTSILFLLRVRQFLNGGDFDAYYTEGRLRGPLNFAITGACVSLYALCLYSIIYAFSRRRRKT